MSSPLQRHFRILAKGPGQNGNHFFGCEKTVAPSTGAFANDAAILQMV
jgi:hypothetical protein